MTNQLTALKELAEDLAACRAVKMRDFNVAFGGKGRARAAHSAYVTGSQDAAEKLHKVVLVEGWETYTQSTWLAIPTYFVALLRVGGGKSVMVKSNSSMARARLHAIVEAKISELEQ